VIDADKIDAASAEQKDAAVNVNDERADAAEPKIDEGSGSKPAAVSDNGEQEPSVIVENTDGSNPDADQEEAPKSASGDMDASGKHTEKSDPNVNGEEDNEHVLLAQILFKANLVFLPGSSGSLLSSLFLR